MTNEEYLRTAPTAELARYITACGYCAYLTDGCQRGQGCVEGHKLWLAREREREGKLTNREALLARLCRYDATQFAEALYNIIDGSDYMCDVCIAGNYCRALSAEEENFSGKPYFPSCKKVIAAWLEAEAENV